MRQEAHKHTAVILDPHPLWLEALHSVLTSIDVEVVGKSCVAEEALGMIEENEPDILVAETGLSEGIRGGQLVRAARERRPTLRVIVLASSVDPADIDTAFEAGALAYVVKTARPEDIAATIRQAFDHSIFLARLERTHSSAPKQRPANDDAGATLTRREREILTLVAEGHPNRDLAAKLWVTEQTVKFHLSNIYRKLDVSNRTEASHWAHQHQLVATPKLASG